MSKLSPMCTNPAEPERVRNPVTYLLGQMKSVCAQHGARLAILNIPRAYDVVPADLRRHIQFERPDLSTLDVTRPVRLLEDMTREVQISLYNPIEDLQAADEPTYFPVFAHWTAAANHIVAAGLGRFLERQGLLGPAPAGNKHVTEANSTRQSL